MDRSKKWENIVKSGSYNRNVKRYSEIDASTFSEQINSSDTEDTSSNNLESVPSTSTIHPPSLSSSQDVPVEVPPLKIDDDVLNTSDDDYKPASEDEYYSPDDGSIEDDDMNNVESDLTSFLRDWSLEFKITHSAMKPLLSRLSQYDRMLPKDPRQLLETPRKTANIVEIQGGQYWHQGLGEYYNV